MVNIMSEIAKGTPREAHAGTTSVWECCCRNIGGETAIQQHAVISVVTRCRLNRIMASPP